MTNTIYHETFKQHPKYWLQQKAKTQFQIIHEFRGSSHLIVGTSSKKSLSCLASSRSVTFLTAIRASSDEQWRDNSRKAHQRSFASSSQQANLISACEMFKAEPAFSWLASRLWRISAHFLLRTVLMDFWRSRHCVFWINIIFYFVFNS